MDARRACCIGEAPEGLLMPAKSGPLPNAKPSLDLTALRNLPTYRKCMAAEHYKYELELLIIPIYVHM